MDATKLDARGAAAILAEIRHEARRAGLLMPAIRDVAVRALLGASTLAPLLALAWTAQGTAVSMLAAGLAGLACTQLGFIAHDAGHGAIGRGRFTNEVAGHLAFTILNGMGFQSWCESHDDHHAFCQDVSKDPDMAVSVVMSLTPGSAADKTGLGRLMLHYQAYYLWPASMLFAHSLRIQGLGRSYRPSAGHVADALLLPLHYVGWFALPSLALGVGSGRIIVVYLMCSAVMGIYLALLFWVNHIGMPALGANHGRTALEQQVVGSRNLRHGQWLDFVYGGLDFQIEHHLIPWVPNTQLRRLQAITRPRCEAADLPYREETPTQALASVTRHVRGIARQRQLGRSRTPAAFPPAQGQFPTQPTS